MAPKVTKWIPFLVAGVCAFQPLSIRPLISKHLVQRRAEADDDEDEREIRAEGEQLAKKLRSNMYNKDGVTLSLLRILRCTFTQCIILGCVCALDGQSNR